MDLGITTSTVGGAAVIALRGTADLGAAPALHGALAAAAATAQSDLVVDLDGVGALDDVAIGLLIGAAARQRSRGGELIVVCTDQRLLDRLAATRVDRILTVRASVVPVLARHDGGTEQ